MITWMLKLISFPQISLLTHPETLTFKREHQQKTFVTLGRFWPLQGLAGWERVSMNLIKTSLWQKSLAIASNVEQSYEKWDLPWYDVKTKKERKRTDGAVSNVFSKIYLQNLIYSVKRLFVFHLILIDGVFYFANKTKSVH